MKLHEINNSYSRDLYLEGSRFTEFMNEVYVDEHRRLGAEWMAVSHGHILLNLFADGELTMTELTNRIRRKAPTTTVLVKKLKKEGYVSSKMSSDDSRVNLIFLTEKGRKHCIEMEKYLSAFTEAAERAVTAQEVETVVKIFSKVRKSIQLELEKG